MAMARNTTDANSTQDLGATDDGDVIQPGRRVLPWTQIHDWIIYSKVSPQAKAIYDFLRSHVNEKRGDQISWPGTEAIGLLLGLSRGDKVAPYLRELRELGAIDVARQRWGNSVRNVYTVHDTPPPGYTGPLSLSDWTIANGPEIVRRKQARIDHSRDQRARKRAGQGKSPYREYITVRGSERPPSVPLSEGVTVVHPVTGVRVHYKPGARVSTEDGVPVQPETGQELPEVELPEVEPPVTQQPPPPPSPVDADASGASGTPEGEAAGTSGEETNPDLMTPGDFADLLRRAAPHWTRRKILEVLGDLEASDHPPLVVRTALLALAREPGIYGRTLSPRRVLADGDWWADAYEALAAVAAPPVRGAVPPRQREVCTTTGCREGYVDLPGLDVPLACPCCRPTLHADQLTREARHRPDVTDYATLLEWVTTRRVTAAHGA